MERHSQLAGNASCKISIPSSERNLTKTLVPTHLKALGDHKMEFAFEFCSTVPMLIVRHSGTVTKKDGQTYISAMLEHPGRKNCRYQPNDFSSLEQIDLDFLIVWAVSEAAKKLYPPTSVSGLLCSFRYQIRLYPHVLFINGGDILR